MLKKFKSFWKITKYFLIIPAVSIGFVNYFELQPFKYWI